MKGSEGGHTVATQAKAKTVLAVSIEEPLKVQYTHARGGCGFVQIEIQDVILGDIIESSLEEWAQLVIGW